MPSHKVCQIVFLFFFMLVPLSSSITCIQQNARGDKKSCEGTRCLTNYDGINKVTLKGCVTGFTHMGCVTDGWNRTMCLCNTTNCNTRGFEAKDFNPKKTYNCSVYTAYSRTEEGREEEEEKETFELGHGCAIIGSSRWTILNGHLSASGLGDGRTLFDLSEQASLDIDRYYYHGVFYNVQETGGDWSYVYRCNGELCNDNVHFSMVPTSTDVRCEYPGRGIDNETGLPFGCHGEFCFLGVREETGEELRYCLTLDQTHAEQRLEVGVYKFQDVDYYICKEDNCNKNAKTAQAAIKRYQKKPVQSVVEPLIEKPLDNSVQNRALIYITLCTSFFHLIR